MSTQQQIPTLRPYISLDIETTGLNLEKSNILQIAAVYDDGISSLTSLPFYNVYIDDPVTYSELGALTLHEKTKIWSKIKAAKDKGETRSIEKAIDGLLDFIDSKRETKFKGGKFPVTLAGKNAATFDIPLLKRWMTDEQKKRFHEMIFFMILDAGSLYFSDFGYIPTLNNILKKIGVTYNPPDPTEELLKLIHDRTKCSNNGKTLSLDVIIRECHHQLLSKSSQRTDVEHDGVSDSLDVIRCIRHKMGVNYTS